MQYTRMIHPNGVYGIHFQTNHYVAIVVVSKMTCDAMKEVIRYQVPE